MSVPPESTVAPSTTPPPSGSESTVSASTIPSTTQPESQPPGDTSTTALNTTTTTTTAATSSTIATTTTINESTSTTTMAPATTIAAIPTTTPTVTTPTVATSANTTDEDADPVTMQPSAAPQVRQSDIPVGSIVLAVFVLFGVGLASYLLARRSPGAFTSTRAPGRANTARPSDDAAEDPGRQDAPPHTATLDFLLGLGQSLIDAGDAASHVESTLRTVARVNGIANIGVVVLPTALIVSIPGDGNVTTEVSGAGRAPLRLDQIDDVLRLVQTAERGEIGAIEGQRRLKQIRTSAHPYPARRAVLGYVCSTVGLAVILRATWREVLLAAVLGAVIGSFRLSTRRLSSSSQPFVPLIAATAVSISVFALARVVDDLVTFPLLIAPLITFLPGALLTIGALELATGHIVSGASRLASGVMQLVLVAIGLVAGRQLVGVPATTLGQTSDGPLAVLAPWVGVAVFGFGIVWFNGARTSARKWILLVLYVAYSGQVVGGLFFGGALSAFFGALAMTPVALFAARQPSGPTPLVAFLPGFWILVPGALGLQGVTRLLDGGPGAGALVTTVTSMIGISLGILLGLTLAGGDPEHPWAETRVGSDRPKASNIE